MAHQWPQMLSIHGGRSLALQPQHQRLTRPVDVRIEHAHARALRRPGECQIRCHRRLADAPFARGDGHDVLDLLDRLQIALNRVRTNVGFELHFEGGGHSHGGKVLA